MNAVLLLLAAVLPPQDPGSRVLTPGVIVHGEITREDVEVTDQALEAVRDQVFLPLRAKRFRIEATKDGSHSIVLDAPLFQAMAVWRDDAGRVITSWSSDGEDWPRVELVAGRTYQLDCCSTLGAVGAFTVQLTDANPRSMAELTSRARERLALRQQELGARALQVGTALDALGFVLFRQSNYGGALACMEQALPIWEQHCGESSVMAAYGHYQLAAQLRGLSRLDAAKSHVESCIRLREAALGADHLKVLRAWSQLGVVEQQRNNLAAAQACFERVLAAPSRDDDRLAELRWETRHNLAFVAKEQGKFTAAKAGAMQALAEVEALHGPDAAQLAAILLTLSNCESELGHHAQAEILARRALAIRRQALPADHADTATALNDLAVILLRRGRPDEAEVQFTECLRIYRTRLGEHWYVAVVQGNLGDCLIQQGRLEDGQRHLREAQALLERLGLGNHPGTAKILRNLAEIDFHRRDWPAAEAGFRRVAELLTRALGPLHPDTLFTRMMLAYLLRLSGRLEEAGAAYPPLHQDLLAVHGPDHPSVNVMAEGTAILHAMAGRNADAFAMAMAAVGGRLRHLGGELVASSSDDRFRDAAALRSSVDLLLTIAGRELDAKVLDTAFEWQAAARGVVYRHVLQQREQLGEQLTEAQRGLRTELEACRAQLAKLAYGAATLTPADHSAKIAALHEQKSELESRLGSSLGVHLKDERIAVADFAGRLPTDAVLLDLAFHHPYQFGQVVDGKLVAEEGRLPERLLAWIVPAGSAHVHRIDLGPAEPIARAVEDFVQDLAQHRGRPTRRKDQKAPNDVLRELLWDPVAGLVGTHKLVFVAADGELAKVPLGALQLADGRFLLEAHNFVCVQDPISLDRDLSRGPPARSAAPRLLALGAVDYDGGKTAGDVAKPLTAADAADTRGGFKGYWGSLPATRGEVEGIDVLHRSQFAGATRLLLTDAAATKAKLVGEAGNFHVLHLATHGFFEPAGLQSLWEQALAQAAETGAGDAAVAKRSALTGYPPGLLAGLVLAGANQKTGRPDGVLTAEEVNGLELARCELVVLSACETALGEMRGGEGMLSLRRAFHEAGARTVISSLWNVNDDSTERLMHSFYENLWQRGLPPAEALWQAQLASLKYNRLRGAGAGLSATWAAFVVSGEWR